MSQDNRKIRFEEEEEDDEFIDDELDELEEEEEKEAVETEAEKELRELNEFIEAYESSNLVRAKPAKGASKKRGSSERVVVELSALLRLFKACADAHTEPARGDIIGHEGPEDDTIHVTACIPQNRNSKDTVKQPQPQPQGGDAEEVYTAAVVDRYKAMHIACDAVGTFECVQALTRTEFIERQAARQLKENPRAVVLVFDPLAATQLGTLSLRAYRLTDAFMEVYRAASEVVDKMIAEAEARGAGEEELDAIPSPMGTDVFASGTRSLASKDLYEELHVFLHGSIPQRQFAAHAPRQALMDAPLAAYPYLERNLSTLGDTFSFFATSASYLNRLIGKGNTDAKQPSFISSLTQGFQVASFCDRIDAAANMAESKLYMVSGLQKDNE